MKRILGPIICLLISLALIYWAASNRYVDGATEAVDSYIDKEYIDAARNYTIEIERICRSTPNQEFLLMSIGTQTIEIILKIEKYDNWASDYSATLQRTIKITLMRGRSNLVLFPIGTADRGTIVFN